MQAIVMATRDSVTTIRKAVESIKENTSGYYQFIISDDSSKTETLDYLRSLKDIVLLEYKGDDHPHLQKVLQSGFDYALKDSNLKYVFTVESDVYVTPDWNNRLVRALESKSDSGGVVGITVGNDKKLMYPMRNDLPPPYKHDWVVDKFQDVIKMKKHLTFGCTVFRAEICRRIKFCKEDRVGGVDVRWSHSIRSLGYELYADLGTYVYHPRPHSSRKEWEINMKGKNLKTR